MNQNLGKALGSISTDPRSEVIMWVAIASPLTYGILKDGFRASKMTSLLGAVLVGSFIWSEVPWFISHYYEKIAGIAQANWKPTNANHISHSDTQ